MAYGKFRLEAKVTYETSLSWLTISANQASSIARWLGVISVKARPIPNPGSEYATLA